MKTIILNGSPKGNTEKSGSYFLAKAFVSEMEQPCEIRSIAAEDTTNLVNYIKNFDHVILVTPNYIHAVPGIVIEFLDQLPPADRPQSYGLIIQSGYPESSESEIFCKYFTCLLRSLNYNSLGTVIKGECAGIALMPDMFKKLAKEFAGFGREYERLGIFSEKYIKTFAEPYKLSKSKVRCLNVLDKIGVTKISWHTMQRKHGGYKDRLARPFLS